MSRLFGLLLVFILASSVFAANSPPGLQKKGMNNIPSFLGTTPPGWNQGVKKGWNKSRDWRWDRSTKYWENKDWRWDRKHNQWEKAQNWGHHH